MRIRGLHIRRFRSIEKVGLTRCGGLNVLIGKNNAGKSNVLSAIELVLGHLRRGRIAGPWETVRRSTDEFTDRDTSRRIQIGIEFDLPEIVNSSLREALIRETTQFERAIDQIQQHDSIAFLISGAIEKGSPYLFLEAASVGKVVYEEENISVSGIRLLGVVPQVGRELFINERQAAEYRNDLASLERLEDSDSIEAYFRERDLGRSVFGMSRYIGDSRPATQRKLEAALKSAANSEEFFRSLAALLTEIRDNIAAIEQKEIAGAITAFAGDTKTPPSYMGWIMEQYGSLALLHLRETKQPIGPEEAAALLRLKVRRGGEERLSAVKQTVRSLLGVNVDAFEPEDGPIDRRALSRAGRRIAEMDINDFIVEANGAGIREALRIILDLELKTPKLVLIEEPEVHLHPGLEQALHQYLLGKSSEVQMFLTTHSTNFVDAASLQNVYLVSRDANRKTTAETVVADDGAFRIPSELGLRLSTVFMFDRLVFVEGRSDEEILRELARRLEIDLTRANVGFVQMGGIRNFAHFAADATLDLLSRRRIQMWFIADRDERSDSEVGKMLSRLSGRAHLVVLTKREIENYLLDAQGVLSLVREKRRTTGDENDDTSLSLDEIGAWIHEEAEALKKEVVRLNFEGKLLRPIYLQSRNLSGDPKERINGAISDLEGRLKSMHEDAERIESELELNWAQQALNLAPGTLVLEKVFNRFGLKYIKEVDGVRLARHMAEVPAEIKSILTRIATEGRC